MKIENSKIRIMGLILRKREDSARKGMYIL